MPSQKFLTNHCPEIESGSFWQLTDCSKILGKLMLGGGGGGRGGDPRVLPPLCM